MEGSTEAPRHELLFGLEYQQRVGHEGNDRPRCSGRYHNGAETVLIVVLVVLVVVLVQRPSQCVVDAKVETLDPPDCYQWATNTGI